MAMQKCLKVGHGLWLKSMPMRILAARLQHGKSNGEERFVKPSWTAKVRDEYLLRKKYDLMFSTYDLNGDGLFSWEDAQDYMTKLEQIAPMDHDELVNFREQIKQYLGDMLGDLQRGMDRWQFVDSLVSMRNRKPERMIERLSKKSNTLWACMDVNNDGTVDFDEFTSMFRAMMIDDEHVCKEIFALLDENNDGEVDQEEMRQLYLDYMMNERPDPFSVIYLSGRAAMKRGH